MFEKASTGSEGIDNNSTRDRTGSGVSSLCDNSSMIIAP